MRPFIWLVLIVGTPFYLWNLATTGKLDAGTALVVLGLFGLAIAAFVNKFRKDSIKDRMQQAQQDYWLQGRAPGGVAMPPTSPPPASPASSPYQCPHCSRSISATDAFCPSCGGRLTMS